MITHPNILAGTIPWTDEPGGLQSMGYQESLTQLSMSSHLKVCGSILSFFLLSNLHSRFQGSVYFLSKWK